VRPDGEIVSSFRRAGAELPMSIGWLNGVGRTNLRQEPRLRNLGDEPLAVIDRFSVGVGLRLPCLPPLNHSALVMAAP
jgi:hypothetical protein